MIGLAAGSNATLLAEQAKALGVHDLAIADANAATTLSPHARVRTGPDAALRLVEEIARPGDVLVALHKASLDAVNAPDVKAKLNNLSLDIQTMQPREFENFLKAELVRWGGVVKAVGLKAEG